MLRLFALLVVVLMLVAGVSYWQSGASGFAGISDQLPAAARDWVTTRAVRTAFGLNRDLQRLDIDVSSEAGVVTLRGSVPTQELRVAGERVAAAVPEVRQVVNHLEVVPGSEPRQAAETSRSMGEALDDEALEAKVRLAFSLNREMDGSDVEVSVYRREVTLSGVILSDRQRARAVEATSSVAGATGVNDQLRVAGDGRPADVRSAVERALADNPHLSEYSIEVVEERGQLTLRGAVRTGAEKDLAALLARDVSGATVRNELEVRP